MVARSRLSVRRAPPLVLLLTLAGACATEQPVFVPADQAGSKSAGGFTAAYYHIEVGGKRYGDVRVWSPGLQRGGDAKDELPRVQVDMRIRNDSGVPLELDASRLSVELLVDKDFRSVSAAPRISGDTTVAPEGVQRLQLIYSLPGDVEIGDLSGYEFSWSLRTPEGLFTQSTPFVRRPRDRDRGMYGPYYHASPYWYGYDPFWRGRFHYWW